MRYIAFYAPDWDTQLFETSEEAEKWLLDRCAEENEEGFSEEVCRGKCYVAKITHKTQYNITDSREEYESEEDWPYCGDFDTVGNISLVEIEQEEFE